MKHRIISNIIFPLLLCVVMVLLPKQASATHFMGGNINYECVGPGQYVITLSVFRDCNGISFNTTESILVESALCNISTTYTAQLSNGYPEIVTPICPTEPDACDSANGTYGVEAYVYKVTINIPDGCSDVVISFEDCCRNNAITTLNGNSNGIYFYTTMDSQEAPCNNSPTFTDELTPFICLGTNVNYSQFASDADGDELVFSLTSCLDDGLNDVVPYITPTYNAVNPLTSSTPITIDPATGLINFTPSALEVGVLCVLVEEFRNGVKIGETIRDLQFTVVNCPPNDPPQVSGFDGIVNNTTITGDFNVNVCWDQQICYSINSFDNNAHNVNLSLQTSTPGATFVVTNNNTPNATAQLCWTPTVNDLGLHYFVITAVDDACPIISSNTTTYVINVNAEDYSDFTYTQDSVNCIGGSDGSAFVSAFGNISPNPTYTWLTDPEQNGQTATGLSAGFHYVLLEDDSLSCPGLLEVEVLEPTALTLSQGPQYTSIDCTIGDNGVLDVTTVGGTTPYTYDWSNGATTQVVTGLTPNTYTVTVSDYYGCTGTKVFFLSSNSNLIISALKSNYGDYNISCHGESDGFVNLFVALGTPPYTFEWSNGPTTQNLANIPAGDYTVTVTDAAGCKRITTQILEEPDSFVVATNVIDAACGGGTSGLGTITVSASGAPIPYTYVWSHTDTIQNEAFDLLPGTYTCTITDVNGCTFVLSESIGSPGNFTVIQTTASSDASCAGATDGVLEVEVTEGVLPYTYEWSNMEFTAQINNLAAGDYTVTVTDGQGCVFIETYTVAEPASMQLTSTLSDYNSFGISCNGESDGNIMISVIGGAPPYTYLWDDMSTSADLMGVSAGFYTITVTDDNLCSISETFELTEPTAIMTSMAVGGANCNGGGDGTASVTPTGGNPPYSYIWTSGSMDSIATGLSAQVYTVTVTDGSGCSATNDINVGDPPLLSVSTTGTAVSCVGGNDGTVTALGDGGAGGYTYLWNTTDITATVTGLTAGTYTVTVTDMNGCTAENMVTIGTLDPIVVTEMITPVSCNGGNDGNINITVTGGSGTYTYVWSDGSMMEDASALTTNNYNVVITDSNGCVFTSNNYNVSEPTSLGIVLTPSDALCVGGDEGSINANISGGTTPYSYSWSNTDATEDISNLTAGTYTLVVTDANGCSLSEMATVGEPAVGVSAMMSPDPTVCFGANTGVATVTPNGGAPAYSYVWSGSNGNAATATSLGVGTYIVTVSDANGCTVTSSVNVNELSDIIIVATSNAPSCDNGTDGTAAVTNISGGAGVLLSDYTINWGTIPPQSGATATGLQAGQTYTITVSDIDGCTGSSSVTLANPAPIEVDLVNYTPVSCSGDANGELTVTGMGGVSPYSYAWSDNQSSDTATGLSLGNYTVTVADANGCTATGTFVVENPTELVIDISGDDANCPGEADGSATINVEGGTPPYAYSWSNGETTSFIDSLASGNYNVTVSDANGCQIVASVYIDQPQWINYTQVVTGVTCNGDRDGSIVITAAGGTPPYQYSLDYGTTYEGTNGFYGMFPGGYGIVVMDSEGCTSAASYVEVEEPLPVEVTIFPNLPVLTYELGDSIQLGVDIINQVGDATISWTALYGDNDMSCTDCAFPLITGQENNRFIVTVTDENGCVGTAEVETIVSRDRQVFVPEGFTPNNDGVNDYLMVHGKTGTRVESFRVYDRWGELVFRADGYDVNEETPDVVWNGEFKGKLSNSDVFVWYLAVRYQDGRKEAFEGSTTLLR